MIHLSPEEYQKSLKLFSSQLIVYLKKGQKKEAMELLVAQDLKYDADDNIELMEQIILRVVNNVLSDEKRPHMQNPARRVITYTHEEKDKIMSELLEMKVLWVSQLGDFNEDIRKNGLDKYPKIKNTQAYDVYEAINEMNVEKALPLIDKFLSPITNIKFKSAIASEMLNRIPVSGENANAAERAIVKKLITLGAKPHESFDLTVYKNSDELVQLVKAQKSKFVYRVG